jgi:hypothetical protein
MDDAVAIQGGTDEARLRLADRERAIGPGPVGPRRQLVVQPPQLPFQVEVEAGDGGAEALALAGGLGGPQEVVEVDEALPEVADPLHGLAPAFSQPPTMLPISLMARAAKA